MSRILAIALMFCSTGCASMPAHRDVLLLERRLVVLQEQANGPMGDRPLTPYQWIRLDAAMVELEHDIELLKGRP